MSIEKALEKVFRNFERDAKAMAARYVEAVRLIDPTLTPELSLNVSKTWGKDPYVRASATRCYELPDEWTSSLAELDTEGNA